CVVPVEFITRTKRTITQRAAPIVPLFHRGEPVNRACTVVRSAGERVATLCGFLEIARAAGRACVPFAAALAFGFEVRLIPRTVVGASSIPMSGVVLRHPFAVPVAVRLVVAALLLLPALRFPTTLHASPRQLLSAPDACRKRLLRRFSPCRRRRLPLCGASIRLCPLVAS